MITRFILPSPPDIPKTKIIAEDNKVTLYWSNNSEASIDPISQTVDFEGYRVFLTKLGFDVTGVPNLLRDLKPLEEYDVIGNQISNEIGLEDITLDSPIQFEGDTTTYYYKYEINNLLNGWQYAVGVSAFDTGDE